MDAGGRASATAGTEDEDGEWDFFVSYTQADSEWAEWIAWQLEAASFRVLVQAWDMVPGSHWSAAMQDGVAHAKRTIAILSHAYLASVFGEAEWDAAWRADPRGAGRKLIPIRVEDCPRPGLLGRVVAFDLFDMPADQARELLLSMVEVARLGRAKPVAEPGFPGAREPAGSRSVVPPEFPVPVRGEASTTLAGKRGSIIVLHLSDLRFGAGERDAAGVGTGRDAVLLAGLVDEVVGYTGRLGSVPDLVVVTGDLTERGGRDEFDRAGDFLAGLADTLGLPRHRFAIIPGDRDVNRDACQAYFLTCAVDGTRPVPPYFPKWRPFLRMMGEFDPGGATAGSFVVDQEWSLFAMDDLKVVVAGFNSTMAVSHRDEDQYGAVGASQCRWFAESLRGYIQRGWLRIGAIHHDPARWADGDGDVENAEGGGNRLRDAADFTAAVGPYLNLLLHGGRPSGDGTRTLDHASGSGNSSGSSGAEQGRCGDPGRRCGGYAGVPAGHYCPGRGAGGAAAGRAA